jgi:hypothetical protein
MRKTRWNIATLVSACSLMGFCVATGQTDVTAPIKPTDPRSTTDELPKPETTQAAVNPSTVAQPAETR